MSSAGYSIFSISPRTYSAARKINSRLARPSKLIMATETPAAIYRTIMNDKFILINRLNGGAEGPEQAR